MTNLEWMQKLRADGHPYKGMTDDQFDCWCMFADLCGGEHHIIGKVKPAGPHGISVTDYASTWSTFDFNRLTRAVVFAHDRCIRFEVATCNMQYLKFYLHKRHKREGNMSEHHPTLESHIATIREAEPWHGKP